MTSRARQQAEERISAADKARKARRFEKSFSCKIEDSVYEVMMNELGEQPQDN